jgi:uncharacterized protein (TIGR02217 family)
MSYINTRLSQCVAYGFAGGPDWSTLVTPYDNGREQRLRQWQYPKHRWSASFLNLDEDARDEVVNAFYATAGQWAAFRFQDRSSEAMWKAVNEPQAPSVGTTTALQLAVSREFGSAGITQLIQAPVSGTLTITKDGSPFTAFTADYVDAHNSAIELVEVRR